MGTDQKLAQTLKAHWNDLFNEGQGLVFHKGQCIYYEGHNPCGIFVLLSGQVRFVSSQKCSTDHLWDSPSGKVLGLDPFFGDRPYCCDCIAKEDCEVVFISKTQLLPFKGGK